MGVYRIGCGKVGKLVGKKRFGQDPSDRDRKHLVVAFAALRGHSRWDGVRVNISGCAAFFNKNPTEFPGQLARWSSSSELAEGLFSP